MKFVTQAVEIYDQAKRNSKLCCAMPSLVYIYWYNTNFLGCAKINLLQSLVYVYIINNIQSCHFMNFINHMFYFCKYTYNIYGNELFCLFYSHTRKGWQYYQNDKVDKFDPIFHPMLTLMLMQAYLFYKVRRSHVFQILWNFILFFYGLEFLINLSRLE